MGCDWYPPVLIYGISVSWDEITTMFGSKEESEEQEEPEEQESFYDRTTWQFWHQLDYYREVVKEKYNLQFFNYVAEVSSRWEGEDVDSEDYLYAIGEQVCTITPSNLLEMEQKTRSLFNKLINERVALNFHNNKIEYILGVKA